MRHTGHNGSVKMKLPSRLEPLEKEILRQALLRTELNRFTLVQQRIYRALEDKIWKW
jgi:hypothetical protein